jgi:hypothetical protein
MAERLLDLMWQLTMSADSPPEVLQSNVIADVLVQYSKFEYIEVYLSRCIEQLRTRQGIYTALHVMSILMLRCHADEMKKDLTKHLEKEVNNCF